MTSTKSGLLLVFLAFTIVFTLLLGIIDVNSFNEDEQYQVVNGKIIGDDLLHTDDDKVGFFKTFLTNIEGAPLFINVLVGFVYSATLFLLITSLPFFNVN